MLDYNETQKNSVLHSTFTLVRVYPASPARVFAAWAEPAAKARWFAGPGTEHELDFRVGGRERVHRGGQPGEPALTFESVYYDIVPDHRIVYSSTLSGVDALATVSITTVQLDPIQDAAGQDAAGQDAAGQDAAGQQDAGQEGTRLVLTEQGSYLDGREQPSWREQGTSQWLAALAAELHVGESR
jgi:uncharacterized protein YndB with AHSA1/START domain